MSPSELTDDVLATLLREFFAGRRTSQWYQQIDLLRQAIAYPAKYLNDRGARLTASQYKAILSTVIDTIKRKGNRGAIERFSPYFAACVQSHMMHQGDRYLAAAKDAEARPVGSLVAGVLRRASGGTDLTVPALAEAHRVLSARGRIRQGKKAPAELDLFAACKPGAKAVPKSVK